MCWLTAIADDIDRHGTVVRATVVRADGSTPRETGAAMVVSCSAVQGTIGGGALELAAIAHARSLLGAAIAADAAGSPSPLREEARGGRSPDLDVLQAPPPCPSPTRGEGTLRRPHRPDADDQSVCRHPEPTVSAPLWRRELRDFP